MTPDQLTTAGEALFGYGWQTRLAADLGVSRASLTSWLTGRRTMPAGIPAEVVAIMRERGAALIDLADDTPY